MFYIIEQEKKLQEIQRLFKLGVFIDVITTNNNYHPSLTDVVCVYVRTISSPTGYIIPINHPEGLNITKERFSQMFSPESTIYTLDKKNLLYHFNLHSSIDVSLLYSNVKHEKLRYNRENPTINHFYTKFSKFKNVNQLIPISILHKSSESIFEQIKHVFDLDIPDNFDFYNKIQTGVFFLLEQSGVDIYYDNFVEMFTPNNPLFNIKDNTVFTSYNLNNTTSRPTNSFNSVNFAAIPKTLEHRKCFRPKNDEFIELDFDGYHIRLLCEQIGYELNNESAHKQLAKLYFGKDEINEEEYKEAKQINFHAIYGKIPEKWSHLEIFTKIDNFIRELWRRFEDDGKVLAPISGKAFSRQLKDMNPQKLMNYIMQSLETSRNVLILKEVLRELKGKDTKIVLYTYDSIVIDYSKKEEQTLKNIIKIMEEDNKYPVKLEKSNHLPL